MAGFEREERSESSSAGIRSQVTFSKFSMRAAGWQLDLMVELGYLVINVFEAAEDDTTCASTSIVTFFFDAFEPDSASDDDGVEILLVAEPLDVLGGVRVNVLQALCEFIIKSVDEGNERPTDLDYFTRLRLRSGIVIGDILSILDNNPFPMFFEKFDKLD